MKQASSMEVSTPSKICSQSFFFSLLASIVMLAITLPLMFLLTGSLKLSKLYSHMPPPAARHRDCGGDFDDASLPGRSVPVEALYLVDFACYKPEKELKISMEGFLKMIEESAGFEEESRHF